MEGINPRRTAAWRVIRKAILAEENDLCGICRRPVDKEAPARLPFSPEIDHVIPLDAGGPPYERWNLQLTHKICNQNKGAKIQEKKSKSEELYEQLVSISKREEFDWDE